MRLANQRHQPDLTMLQQLPRRLVSNVLLLATLGLKGFQPLFLFIAEPFRLMRAIPENKPGRTPSSSTANLQVSLQ